jgi:outer membrane protein TolC
MEAMEAYWTWVKSYQTYKVIEQNVEINRKRLALVTASYQNGERPAIDTIEALTQLQSFEYEKNAYWLDFQNTGLELSAFLWTKDEMPYVLPENIVPQDGWENEVNIAAFNLSLENLLTAATINHPDLQIYDYKLEALQIDKKLKLQELLPKLDVSYNQLGKDFNLLKTTVTGPLFRNNFQYGLKFEMPLRFSQGRGDYKNAKLKIAETELGQSQKQLQIAIKIKSYYNEFETLKRQVALQSENYNNYQRLVKAEESRLTNGESSLFVVNTRETKALEAYEKLIALKTKYFKTVYALQWSAGLLQ